MTKEKQMFCFQCEQTAMGTGCTGCAGVCGKSAVEAGLQDVLTGALVGLARTCQTAAPTAKTYRTILEGMFTTITNVNFNTTTTQAMIDKVHAEAAALSSTPAADYDMNQMWDADEDIRSLKSLILFGMRGMAAYAYHALMLGKSSEEVDAFFVKGLSAIGEDWGMDELLPIVMETGKVNLTCMALLDEANTSTYGTPVPTTVPLTVEKGPFIVVTGHDLKDLELLLKQTEGKGINIYTHGEMLPAHAYPELKKYKHLKGNFGTAWQNQQKEFDGVPGAFLFTTNCLMPPRKSYIDRVFTTEVVSFDGVTHIGEDKTSRRSSKKPWNSAAMQKTSTSPASTAAAPLRLALVMARSSPLLTKSSTLSKPALSNTSSSSAVATALVRAVTTTRNSLNRPRLIRSSSPWLAANTASTTSTSALSAACRASWIWASATTHTALSR